MVFRDSIVPDLFLATKCFVDLASFDFVDLLNYLRFFEIP